ncbi:hypothetical protein F2Q69_00025170 [Brassica cretica]|uniref:Uncharacterized protein n=1 Tax=Brassica cretica TaxID=69181 RepID=A0A8S9QAF1_BRACR|nr:hypothetical protein F2Q69_00025170 [Brassica cretica]
MEERSKCLQIEVEGELPTILREATTEVVNFDNHKENSLPRPPRFISRFHHSHASTSDLNGLEASSSSASKTMEAHQNEDLKETKPGMTINHQRKTSLPMPTSPIDHMIADPTSSSSDNNKNGGSTGKSIKISSKTHVQPNKPILGKQQFQLTTFDLPYLAFYYNQKFLLYKFENLLDLEEPTFQNNVVEKLKDGLGSVLEDFYQLAGKLAKEEEGVFRVEYDADDEEINGVEFSVADAADVSVDDLTAEDGTAQFKELVPYNGILNLEGLRRPLLAVQVII